jgi:integrase
MAEPLFLRNKKKWYARVKDRFGRWRSFPLNVRTKSEARELNRQHQVLETNIARGLLAPRPEDVDRCFGAMVQWWLDNHLKAARSYQHCVGFVRMHLLGSSLARLAPAEVTPGKVEEFLTRHDGELSPASVNHLRAFIFRIFKAARAAERFHGQNPVTRDVRTRKVPKRKGRYLKPQWVPPILDNVPAEWQGVFATAVYAGLRKGEILALQKSDVDLDKRIMLVGRSHDSDTTKGGHEDGIPIAKELVPYLRVAIDASPNDLIFPRPDGSRHLAAVDLVSILRTAMRRAGIVEGYVHKCRRCGHSEESKDGEARTCPDCNMKLWTVGKVAPFRFHDLRHTTASLLMMSGASPAAVQRILRHTDIRVTTEVYGHLAPEYLQTEIDRLSFRPKPAASDEPAEALAAVVAGAESPSTPLRFASPVLPEPPKGSSPAPGRVSENIIKSQSCLGRGGRI